MTVLHLVRHGRPVVDPARPPATWELDADSAAEVETLRRSGVLPAEARWFSSPEPKAHATARALTDTAIGLVDSLREMIRPAGPWHGAEEWTRIVHRAMTVLDEPAVSGWETGAATQDRVTAALRRIRESCPDDDLVLAGHGTAWTLLVSALTASPPDLAAWSRLSMPDHCALDLAPDGVRMLSPWGAWRRAT